MPFILTQQLLAALVGAPGADILARHALLNDCFAPPPPMSERPHRNLLELRAHPQLQMLPLDNGFSVAFVPSLSQVAVLDDAVLQLLARLPLGDAHADIATLDSLAELWQAGLLASPDEPSSPAAPPETTTLSAWMHVTNACNLRCTYCYVAKSNEAMSHDTALRGVEAIFRSAKRHGYRQVFIKYAGGEPTLALDTVALAHEYARRLADANQIELDAAILSNGTALTAERLAVITKLGLRLMVSLDGLGAANDAQRPSLGGHGSALAAMRGVRRALEAGITPEIGVSVSGQNVSQLPPFIDWLLDHDLPFSLSFVRDHGCGSFADLRLEEQQLVDGMRRAYERIAQRPPRWSVLNALLDRADLSVSHGRTCAAGHSYLVIDHQGRVAGCQTQLAQPSTTVKAADPLLVLRNDAASVRSVHVDLKEGCRSCEWRYWCAGGCPVATYRATGRYDVQSPNCTIYKALYPDVLRLEGRRLLHWMRVSGAYPPGECTL